MRIGCFRHPLAAGSGNTSHESLALRRSYGSIRDDPRTTKAAFNSTGPRCITTTFSSRPTESDIGIPNGWIASVRRLGVKLSSCDGAAAQWHLPQLNRDTDYLFLRRLAPSREWDGQISRPPRARVAPPFLKRYRSSPSSRIHPDASHSTNLKFRALVGSVESNWRRSMCLPTASTGLLTSMDVG